jgi:serine protease
VAGTAADSDTREITVTVDRAGLPEGTFFGRVVLSSNGGQGEIQVSLEVGVVRPGGPTRRVFVLAVDTATDQAVAQAVVQVGDPVAYSLRELPPGTYLVAAGSDDDDDGFICGPGELCGLFPVDNAPLSLELVAGESATGIDITVAPRVGADRADAGPPRGYRVLP